MMQEQMQSEDPFDQPEYQDFVEECAKGCMCENAPCDGCLAGGVCDGPSPSERDEEVSWEDEEE